MTAPIILHEKQTRKVVATSLHNLGNGTDNEGEAIMRKETELMRAIDFSRHCAFLKIKKIRINTLELRIIRGTDCKSRRDYAENQLPMQRNFHCPLDRPFLLNVC